MGYIELLEFDFSDTLEHGPIGAAGTTNINVVEDVKQNPIGFIWEKTDAKLV